MMSSMHTTTMINRLLLFALALLVLQLNACMGPKTKRVQVDQEQMEIEREYQRRLTLERQVKYQKKLVDVSWPVLRAAVPLCEDDENQFRPGITAVNQYSFREDYRDAAKELFGVEEERLGVIYVAAESPAQQAGLQEGDIILEVNSEVVLSGEEAETTLRNQFKQAFAAGPDITLLIEREGEAQTIEFVADKLCFYPTILTMDDAVNAYADGSRIIITKGMLRFVESDTELSLVVAHELAHNMMSHIEAKTTNYWLGTLADIAAAAVGVNTQGMFGQIAASSYSQAFESEADYVGIYILALADMDIDGVADFWRRMAIDNPGSINADYSSSHPSSPERFLAIELTVEEIEQKRLEGLPLRPEERPDTDEYYRDNSDEDSEW